MPDSVVDPISHVWYFNTIDFLKDLAFNLAEGMDRNSIPTRVTTREISLPEK